MKRFGVILLFLCMAVSIVSASVEVHNYSFKDSYFPSEIISGEINLSIIGEDFDSKLTSSEGDSVVLGDFLWMNGATGYCSPPDCSNDYSVISSSSEEEFIFGSSPVYVGLVLEGENVAVTGLNFDIESNFNSTIYQPLSINFFENMEWDFNEFSDNFSQRYWGCFDPGVKSVGPLIGTSSYCEMITITETNAVYVGADVSGEDDKNLTMVFYPEMGSQGKGLGDCITNL